MAGKKRRANEPSHVDHRSLPYLAWERHVVDLPIPLEPWCNLVEMFVSRGEIGDAERAAAVALVALDNVHDWGGFVRGDWILLATTHVYLHFTGGGYRSVRTLAVVERLVRFVHREQWIGDWDRACLLSLVDDAREGSGGRRTRAQRCFDRCFMDEDLPRVAGAVVSDPILTPVDRDVIVQSVRAVAAVGRECNGYVRFGALDPEVLLSIALSPNPEAKAETAESRQRSAASLLRTAQCIYAWLGRSRDLSPERAQQLHDALVRLSMSLMRVDGLH